MIFEGDMLRVEKDSNNSVFTTIGIVEFDRGVFMLRTTTENIPLYQILTLDVSVTILGNEVTDKKKVLLQRINEFLDSCIPDFTDDMTEQQEMYGIIKQAKELLENRNETERQFEGCRHHKAE